MEPQIPNSALLPLLTEETPDTWGSKTKGPASPEAKVVKARPQPPPPTLPAQRWCTGTQGSQPQSWPGPGSWTCPQSSGTPWQDQHPRQEPSGPRVPKNNVFNWLLAGAWAPSTPQKDRDVHTRGSLHKAERQITESDKSTQVPTQEYPWGQGRSTAYLWNQAPAFITRQ